MSVKDESIELVEGVDIPTREAKKGLALMWESASVGTGLEWKDLILLAIFITNFVCIIVAVL